MFQRVTVRERCESKATSIGLCRYERQRNPLQQSKNLFEYHSSSCSCGHLLHHQKPSAMAARVSVSRLQVMSSGPNLGNLSQNIAQQTLVKNSFTNMVPTKPVYQYDSDEIEGAPVNKWLPT
ncbi:hypothetical protein HanIR_Chr15g0761931 [Helianthus annuus]|nr:hypothetical protein HanIR_Chr15g0761931 [Helianthus annuus]